MTYIDSPSQSQPTQPPEAPRKKHRVRRWLFITSAVFAAGIAVLTVLGVVLSAAFNDAASPKQATGTTQRSLPAIPPNPGPTANPDAATPASNWVQWGSAHGVIIGGDGEKATISAISHYVTTQPADTEFGEPPQHGYYLVVKVRAHAAPGSTSGFDISSSDFYTRVHGQHFNEGSGNAYEALPGMGNGELDYVTLAPSERTSGLLVFDVPSPHGVLAYAPNYNGIPLARWRY